jgi:putative sigma-54 modulation protein
MQQPIRETKNDFFVLFNLSAFSGPKRKIFMKVNSQSVNFVADKKLMEFIQERMDKLEQFYDKVISSDVYLKVENTSSKENKIVEIKVKVPRNQFIVKKQCKSFEEAVDIACHSLERQLVKTKEKMRAHA